MPASTRALTALFLLLVAAGHQPSETSVAQVQAALLLREGTTERRAPTSRARGGTSVVRAPAVAVVGSPAPKRRQKVMAGDLPAPRAPDA